jgi:hypothetical protein
MPNERNELAVVNENKIRLHDNGIRTGSIIEQSVRSLNEEQVQAIGSKAARN